MKHQPHATRRAFTLIETVISLSIVSVLFVGLSGAVMIGAHALPTAKDTGLADQSVIDALNMFRTDLRQATDIHYKSDSSGIKLKLDLKENDTTGEYKDVTYCYLSSSKSFTREPDGESEVTLFESISGFSVQFTMDGSDATVVKALIANTNTIQPIYEVHALLPLKPEVH
tara:strand:+ start:124597 stop:125109 length:513 start_codon:yes stop_codon:yes gene_type:complete